MTLRLEERLSPFAEYPYRVGPLSRRAKRTEVSLSLSHSFRKFLGLQVFPFSKPVQMPEGSKGLAAEKSLEKRVLKDIAEGNVWSAPQLARPQTKSWNTVCGLSWTR